MNTPTNMIKRRCDTCGHVGQYQTEGLANYHFPRHSCTTNAARTARRARVRARVRADGPRRDCQHKQAQHQHGTSLGYKLDGCRCRPCREATRISEQQRRRNIAYGRPGNLVDAAPVAAHLRQLMAQGMGLHRICAVSGLPHGTVSAILYRKGSQKPADDRQPRIRIRRAAADQLLTLTVDLADGAHVDSTGTVRRLQALVTVGWSISKIADHLGMLVSNLAPLAHGDRGCTVATRRRITDLYDQWWDQQPPQTTRHERGAYTRATRYAGRHGWLPPQAWDDDLIDDPHHQPAATLINRRTTRTAINPDDVEWLHESGLTFTGIVDRLGIRRDTLQTILQRAGRRDLWLKISEADRRRRDLPRTAA